jgi:hypothetical protein
MEKTAMISLKPMAAAATFTIALALSATAGSAGDIKWEKYMNSAGAVAAIAAAVAFVDGCSKPLQIEETRQDGEIWLTFNCAGGEDEEAAATITFDDFGGVLIPKAYAFAG